MGIPKVPGFPYFFLVRLPIVYLVPTLIAGLLSWLQVGYLGLPWSFWDGLESITVAMVLLGATLQLLWVPMGGTALMASPIRLSAYAVVAHLLAMLCGALQFVLLYWQISMSVFA